MANWKYELDASGKKLRDILISDEAELATIQSAYEQTINCLNEIKSRLHLKDKEIWEDDIDNMIDDLQVAHLELINEELDYEEEEENFNNYLNNFYDLCDSMQVWIGL